MDWNVIRQHVESRIVTARRLPKRPMIAGVMSGLIAGITLGAFTGPIGMALGFLIGTSVGLVAGYMLAEEQEVKNLRHRELDEIIGITRGSMGAGPIIRKKDEDEEAIEVPAYSTKEAWLAEWLTPPPPNVLS
jgi:hypothetical protein